MITGQPTLPFITPMLATPCREPVDGSDWVFEAKHDGFRALTYVDGHCPLLSRNGYRFSGFDRLEEAFAQTLRGHNRHPRRRARLPGRERAVAVCRTWYRWAEKKAEGWLCPAFFKYFKYFAEAPPRRLLLDCMPRPKR
jgi:hypothetical protein